MRLTAFAALAMMAGSASAAQVGPNATASPGSEQRKAILDALRPSVEAELGGDIEFVPSCIQVLAGWAFVSAEPQRKGGRAIPRTILPDWENRDGLTVTALFHFRHGRWALIERAIGATDAWYDGRAPAALFRQVCR
jgi:hypothetical protein